MEVFLTIPPYPPRRSNGGLGVRLTNSRPPGTQPSLFPMYGHHPTKPQEKTRKTATDVHRVPAPYGPQYSVGFFVKTCIGPAAT